MRLPEHTLSSARGDGEIAIIAGLADAPWRTSTRSQTSNCVDVAPLALGAAGDRIGVRDSKDPDAAILLFDRKSWAAFTGGIASLAGIERPSA